MQFNKKWLPLILTALVPVLTGGVAEAVKKSSTSQHQPMQLSFGVVPQQSATRLAQLWGPVLAYLAEKTGYRIYFKTAKDIPTFEQRVSQGEYDISYMNPYHYTVFHDHPGYVAFAKERDNKIQGIVVVRKDAPFQTIQELSGMSVAFPAPAAFAATVLPRAYFRKYGLSITPKYVSSHDSVYRAVAKGIYPAGGGIQRTFETTAPEIQDTLRILWTTDSYTPHALAAHPRVPAEMVAKLQRAMVQMADDVKGRALLDALGFKGIDPAVDADWDDVRSLEINLL